MKCPRDGTELVAERYEGDVEIDVCGACHGQFLDKGELERIQSLRERSHSGPEQSDASAAYEQVEQLSAEAIACPKCGTEMARRPYGFGSQTVIEVCPEDCGMWLDAGELEALERFYERQQQGVDSALPLPLRIWLRASELFSRK